MCDEKNASYSMRDADRSLVPVLARPVARGPNPEPGAGPKGDGVLPAFIGPGRYINGQYIVPFAPDGAG
jgi:hypothetical protein